MRHIINPEQNELFDYYQCCLSPVAYKRLTLSYHAMFRQVILSLLPADELSEHFDESMGRPTKELYSMAGLVLLKEFHNWTVAEAVDAYLFDARVQYALNLGRENISFCERTLERYTKLIREDKLAGVIFERVTMSLIEKLDLAIDKQRLDSTHVFSDMATFSRTKLMGVTVRRFLVQLKRHHSMLYAKLPETLRSRYEKSQNTLFADVSNDKKKRSSLRQEVAEEMYGLIRRFSGNARVESMTSFKDMLTVFEQQCEVKDIVSVDNNNDDGTPPSYPSAREVLVRRKTGGDVMQNPSDPDATYDGHKGSGYQVQITETASPENDVQLVVEAIPETAVEHDSAATGKVLSRLEEKNILPDTLLGDSLFGSDENVLAAREKGVELISPVAGPATKRLPKNPSPKQLRLQERRELQKTEEWRKEYNARAQIEGTIGSIKRRTGMSRLRYRGKSSVFASIYLKLTGWNISRALKSFKIQKLLKERVLSSFLNLKKLDVVYNYAKNVQFSPLKFAA